eukprot:8031230-Pyramimonas_sp.AAC.1
MLPHGVLAAPRAPGNGVRTSTARWRHLEQDLAVGGSWIIAPLLWRFRKNNSTEGETQQPINDVLFDVPKPRLFGPNRR